MTVEYFLGDHLGSTSITTDAAGAKISEMRYKPWGETRYTWTNAPANTSPTYELPKYQFTGQYSYTTEFGLMFYGARFYDSAVGRFVSADTMIPQSQGTQAYDRYAYTNNNPLRYTDPTGHFVNILAGMLIGVVVGAAVSYGRQVITNAAQDGWSADAFTNNIDFVDIGASALVGAGAGGLMASGLGVVALAAGQGMAGSALGYTLAAGEDYSTGAMMGSAVIGGAAGAASGGLSNQLAKGYPYVNPTGGWMSKIVGNAGISASASFTQAALYGDPEAAFPIGVTAGGASYLVDVGLIFVGMPTWASTPISSFVRSAATETLVNESTDCDGNTDHCSE
jgi:RHS repeat-associated protein